VPRRAGGSQQIPRPDIWSEHHETPWTLDVSWSVDDLIASVPATSAPPAPTFPDARLSAVLIVLADGPTGAEVLLTRRSMELKSHRGEISFPGGRVDQGETAVEAALRESHEEVGLDPTAPEIVGELEHMSTIVSKSYITPVVSRLDHRPRLEPQTMEADRVMWTPIRELTRPGTYRLERWGNLPSDRPLHFFELDDETVWGATARMLFDLLTLADR
jgi:peroxisomal coenzyme A diphosphatase NUDT7